MTKKNTQITKLEKGITELKVLLQELNQNMQEMNAETKTSRLDVRNLQRYEFLKYGKKIDYLRCQSRKIQYVLIALCALTIFRLF